MTDAKTVDPVALLRSDLTDEEPEIQLEGCEKIAFIARLIGPQKTKEQLLPLVSEFLQDDNDEAMVLVGKQLGFIAKELPPADLPGLVPILQKLISQDETVVCEAATNALSMAIERMRGADVEKTVIPALGQMVSAAWFQPRVFASKLFKSVHVACGREGEGKAAQVEGRILDWIKTLGTDANPMVKKASFIALSELADLVQKSKVKADVTQRLSEMCKEESDLMRVHSVGVCRALSRVFSEEKEFASFLWPVVQRLAQDPSWRVRKEVATDIPVIAKSVGQAVTDRLLLPAFLKLLGDRETEVKVAAAGKLSAVCKTCPEGGMSKVTPALKELMQDPNQGVRIEASSALGELVELFTKNQGGDKAVMDILMVAQKDQDGAVRVNIMEVLGRVAKRSRSCRQYVTVLASYAADPKWRVRREYLRTSTAFASFEGKTGTGGGSQGGDFENKLVETLIQSLTDQFWSIREEACAQLGNLAKGFGGDWAVNSLLPRALKATAQEEQANYIARMTGLRLMEKCAPYLNPAQIEKAVLPFVQQCLEDSVDNVRFKAAKALGVVIPLVSRETVDSKLVPALRKCQTDEMKKSERDSDVLYYSDEALSIAARLKEQKAAADDKSAPTAAKGGDGEAAADTGAAASTSSSAPANETQQS